MRTVLPAWVVKAIVVAVLTALVTGASVWGANLTASRNDHEKKIAVLDEHQKNTDKTLDKIEASQMRIEDKLDRALRRR